MTEPLSKPYDFTKMVQPRRMSEIRDAAQRLQPTEAGDLSSWMDSPHRLAVDAKGYVWRAYTDEEFWSMAPVNSDNSPIPQPVTYYVPEVKVTAMREALIKLADLHHRMLTNSKKHDPETREFWDCDCLTCRAVADLVGAPTAAITGEASAEASNPDPEHPVT